MKLKKKYEPLYWNDARPKNILIGQFYLELLPLIFEKRSFTAISQ